MDLREAYQLAGRLVAHHGLEGWSVTFDAAKRRAGACWHQRRVISLSAPLTKLHEEAEVRDTILHEIAHALVGHEAGHGPIWKARARSIGCSAARCVPADAPRVPGAWMGVCAAGHTRDRHQRPHRVVSCPQCVDEFSLDAVYEWTYRGRPAPMHPNYVAELQALREGRRLVRLGPGTRVRIMAPGAYQGRTGVIVKRGTTRYHVQLPEGVLTVVFAAVSQE